MADTSDPPAVGKKGKSVYVVWMLDVPVPEPEPEPNVTDMILKYCASVTPL